jgi:hypothetical protein
LLLLCFFLVIMANNDPILRILLDMDILGFYESIWYAFTITQLLF